MLERVQSNDVGQLMWADNSWGAVRRGVRGKGVGRVKCRAQGSETRQSELGCMGLHEGEGGGSGSGMQCTGMMRESGANITSESVGMHEVEVVCETVARWVGFRQSCCAELC